MPAYAVSRQKAPSAIRCIKTGDNIIIDIDVPVSESTERHKVH